MGSKRILTARVMENMVVAEDVYTSDEQLLIPEGTVLTGEIIDALKERSIFAIRVKVGEDGKTPIMGDAEPGEAAEVPPVEGIPDVSDLGRDMLAAEPDEEKDYYQAVRETKEFQEFQEAFIQTVDNLKDVFNRVVMQNEKIDS